MGIALLTKQSLWRYNCYCSVGTFDSMASWATKIIIRNIFHIWQILTCIINWHDRYLVCCASTNFEPWLLSSCYEGVASMSRACFTNLPAQYKCSEGVTKHEQSLLHQSFSSIYMLKVLQACAELASPIFQLSSSPECVTAVQSLLHQSFSLIYMLWGCYEYVQSPFISSILQLNLSFLRMLPACAKSV